MAAEMDKMVEEEGQRYAKQVSQNQNGCAIKLKYIGKYLIDIKLMSMESH